MSEYTEFFLNRKSSIVQLELLEITHSSFSQVYKIVRNARNGVTVTHEDSTVNNYIYYPLRISAANQQNDLDQMFKVELGDLGEIVPTEIDRVVSDSNFEEKPIVKYRVYSSANLNSVLFGPIVLEIKTFSFSREGCMFEAKAPSLNINKTGELYTFDRFPMLKGFL